MAKDKFDQKIFKEILEAYDTLSDPVKKQSYDLGLSNPAFSPDAGADATAGASEDIRKNRYSETFYKNK